MLRKSLVTLSALFVLAACADGRDPMAPELAGPLFSNGNAFHTLQTPAAPTAAASGATSIRITWAATIEDLQSECDAQAAANTEHSADDCRKVHFELYRNGVQIADVEGSSYEDTGLAPGSYSYTLKAFGHEHIPGSGEAAFTYHSGMSGASNVVVLGGGYSIMAVGGNCQTGTAPNTNAATWNLAFQLYFGGTLVTDGTAVYVNGSLANYDAAQNQYLFNNTGGGTESVEWQFNVGAVDGPAAPSFTCSAPVTTTGRRK
jgi:hypothetical protein